MIGKKGQEWRTIAIVILATALLVFMILVSKSGAEEIKDVLCMLPWC